MYRFKKSLVALMGVLTLGVIITVSMPHIGRGASEASSSAPTNQTQNVNVVNTPSVNALQSGPWNVGISGTPTVSVSNFPATSNVSISGTPVVALDAGNNTVKFDAVNSTVKVDTSNPLLVRDVDNGARQSFRKSVFVSLADGSTFAAINPGITPPAGKRLVLEAISVGGNIPSGQKYACSLNITDEFAQVLFDLDLALVLQGTFGPVDTFQGNTITKVYVESSDNIAFDVFRNAGSGAAGMRVSFSGYLVDIP
jgi:hypothetical protein